MRSNDKTLPLSVEMVARTGVKKMFACSHRTASSTSTGGLKKCSAAAWCEEAKECGGLEWFC